VRDKQLDERNERSFDWAADAVERALSAWWQKVPTVPPAPMVDRQVIEESVRRYQFDEPIIVEQLVRDVATMMEAWSVHTVHPRYFGLFVPSVHPAEQPTDLEELAARIREKGDVWISSVELDNTRVLRACITSYRTTPADLEVLIDSLRTVAAH
jgi:hypothetical protein